MKLIIKKSELYQAIGDVMKAVSTRNLTIPALSTIKIVVESDKVILTGSNSDISIVSTIPAKVEKTQLAEIEKEGAVCVSAKYFAEIIRKLPSDMVEISADENFKLHINANGSKFNLNGMDPDEYPLLPKINAGDVSFKVKSNVLKSMIKNTIFAVYTEQSRPILTGANWTIKDGIITTVVTDSHRLVKYPITIIEGDKVDVTLNIPGASLRELEKLLYDDDSDVTILSTQNHVLFQLEDLLFYSRLLEGTYPDTSKFMSIKCFTTVSINKNKLIGAVDRAALLAKESKNHTFPITIEIAPDKPVRISSQNPEIGEIEEFVECDVEGDELKISASSKYILEALNALESDQIVIKFSGDIKPFIIQEKDKDEIIHLILPVRTL